MGELQVEVEPSEVGFEASRLTRIDTLLAGYVDDGRLPGWLVAVWRHGRLAHLAARGHRDAEARLPVETDTQWRIYSMTKPVTSVAAMMLWEEGAFQLTDPVSRFIPAFSAPRVYRGGPPAAPVTEPAGEPIRIWHLLTHTAGLTYGFHHVHPVDAMYRSRGFEWSAPTGFDLDACCSAWAELPLLFHPGAEWNYSVATDVLGRVVEVASGQSLDEFFRTRIFEPLGMADTTFGPADPGRLAALYNPAEGGGMVRNDTMGRLGQVAPRFLSGGSGLVSTAADYHRFTQMLLRGGALDGVRLLGSRTLSYMTRNHLPGGADLQAYGRVLFAETPFTGVGFGLGFSVLLDPVAGKVTASPGEYAWGGAASTVFWVDPVEDIIVLFFTQLLPSSTYPIRAQLRQLVYQALID